MKKISVIAVSALIMTSVFAWSKKGDDTANLGRMYIDVDAGAKFYEIKSPITADNTPAKQKSTPVGAAANLEFNVPLLKPNVNVLKDVSWFGLDTKAFFHIEGSNWGDAIKSIDYENESIDSSFMRYNVGAALIPYLQVTTGWEYFKAIKPFGIAYVGYEWMDYKGESNGTPLVNGGKYNESYVIYGVGGGVEILITESLSVTPSWMWMGNAKTGLPCTQKVGIEGTYWLNGIFGVSLFWDYDFGSRYNFLAGDNSNVPGADISSHLFGVKVKIGFNR